MVNKTDIQLVTWVAVWCIHLTIVNKVLYSLCHPSDVIQVAVMENRLLYLIGMLSLCIVTQHCNSYLFTDGDGSFVGITT